MNSMIPFRHITTAVLLFCAALITAQPPTNWHLSDPEQTDYNGIALDRLQAELTGSTANEVIVAILDTGIDDEHEDLRGRIWVNEDEIPGNGKDDDGNGYVDDIHGWNFLGGPDGQNVIQERLEVTRLYARDKAYFSDKDVTRLSRKDEKRYRAYLGYKKVVEAERTKAREQTEQFNATEKLLLSAVDAFDKKYPHQKLTPEFLDAFDPGDNEQLLIVDQIFEQVQSYGAELNTIKELREEIVTSFDEARKSIGGEAEYWYNPDYNPREIVGDDYDDPKDRYYGNNDTKSAYAFHGTHVAGIVGARADNDKGARGICQDVRLMSVRMLADGDEHDKDVANAIRYAVDNGASIINMSFGKGYSWDKKTVDKAVRYARKHDVLLVHAAGNGAMNNDEETHFPVRWFEKYCLFGKKEADNWLEIGALHWEQGERAIAPFSHYGKESVDLFAPGVMIYSTSPDNTYEAASGTSFAAPVVSGVAALIRSHFPSLSAQQVRQILLESSTPIDGKVYVPGTDKQVDAGDLSISGGAVNAYNAYMLALKTVGKKNGKPAKQSRA